MAARQISGITRRCISSHTGATAWAPTRMGAVYSIRGALVLVLIASCSFPVMADHPVNEQNRPLDDVRQAFNDLTHHGEWLGFHNGDDAPLRHNDDCSGTTHHYQGVARSSLPGTPYFFVTSSGIWTGEDETGQSDGNLMVVKMGSRDGSGERLRSNRLLRGAETSCTLPPEADRVVKNITFPNYVHPGAMHLIGDILVVPLENARKGPNICNGGTRDGFFCSSNDDCPDGTCFLLNFCDGGDNNGQDCFDDDCPDGTCIKNTCDGGQMDGEACSSVDCPGGTCIKRRCDGGTCTSQTCQGGGDHGNPCSRNDQCAFGGTCDDGSCVDGSNHGETCSSDGDCAGSCRALPESRIQFFDVSHPEEDPLPLLYSLGVDHGAAAVGLAKLSDGHFLLCMAWGGGEEVVFWRSNKTSFSEDGFKFEYHDTWRPPSPTACSEPWAAGCSNTYQNFSLVTQTDGSLFLIAGRNENIAAPIVPGDDFLVLFEITGFEVGQEIEITQQGETRIVYFKNDTSLSFTLDSLELVFCGTCFLTEAINADLLAGATAYVTPSGELLYYAVAHYNDGPQAIDGEPVVRMAELRHKHVVRSGSPTYSPMADAGGPYVVDEGSSILLDGGNSVPSLAEPWAQLFEHVWFEGQSVMLDHADKDKDDYDNFRNLDGQLLLDLCIDSTALAEVVLAGELVTGTFDNLNVLGLMGSGCIGFVVDDACWSIPPHEGRKLCGSLPGLPEVCGECFPRGTPLTNRDCNFPGLSSVFVPVPDFDQPGWDLFGQLIVLADKLADLLGKIEVCGRLPGAWGAQPPRPPSLNWLDPDFYPGFDLSNPDTFPSDLVNNLGLGLNAAGDYIGSLDDYLIELIESIYGFNNRASSVRWYAPVGVDIVLYEDANFEGELLTLSGTGKVEWISDLFELDFPESQTEWHASDIMRSMRFDGEFVSPTLVSHLWTIASPDPSEPLALGNPTTVTPTFDASGADGPLLATVQLRVGDSSGGGADTFVNVQVLNVAPTIDSIGPDQFIAEGESVTLGPVRFGDPGIPDTHTATIDWGDGSPLDAGTVIQDLVAGGGTMAGSHAYGDNGTYVVTVTVTDDDGGCDSGVMTVEVTNLDPTLTLDTSGTTAFRVGQAVLGRVGVGQSHQASSTDPGSDDLRFVWTALEEVSGDSLEVDQTVYFNNGQSPDPFPSALGTFPFDADDTAEATFPRPGLYHLSVGVTDDDGGSAVAGGLPILVAGDADCSRSVGNWRRQFAESARRRIDDATLLGLLSYANFASSYFSEQLTVQSIAQAWAVLQPGGADLSNSPSNAGGNPNSVNMRGQAVQRVFVVWLSVASGALDLREVLPDGATLLEALYAAEDILADPSTTHHDHILILQRMNAINNRDCP